MLIVPIMTPAQSSVEAIEPTTAPQDAVESVAESLDVVSIKQPATKSPAARKPSVRMSVPLDAPSLEKKRSASPPRTKYSNQTTTVHGVTKLLRRDSLERREALLKGKEGTRQRRRWENDRLLSNPWAEPPLPSDWEVRPTHTQRSVPYYLAPLWDAAEFQRAIESKLKGNRRNSVRYRRKHGAAGAYRAGMSPFEEAASNIPKEVKARLKHARSAKGLLQDLEEDVRAFVKMWNLREQKMREKGLGDAPVAGAVSDEEDEEIVFVGRNGAMHDSPSSPTASNSEQRLTEKMDVDDDDTSIAKEKLVFEGLEHDKGAGFARWLVHCVGDYYGLKTWSVTKEVDGESRREAYVGVDSRARGWMGRTADVGREFELPRPLWGMV